MEPLHLSGLLANHDAAGLSHIHIFRSTQAAFMLQHPWKICFAFEWFAFKNATPNHITALNQQKENTVTLYPGVNPTAVFLEVFMTCWNSPGINYSQNPQHFISKSILLLSSLSLLLKPSASHPYIDPYSPLSCDAACSEFLSLLAILNWFFTGKMEQRNDSVFDPAEFSYLCYL